MPRRVENSAGRDTGRISAPRSDVRVSPTLARCSLLSASVVLICLSVLGTSGCSRSFWRNNADDNAYDVLGEKLNDPRWIAPRLDVTPDPNSRFYDPTDPDHAPLPPDDPSAHQYMRWMGGVPWARRRDKPWAGGVLWPPFARTKGFRGWKGWHKYGELLSVENPQWLAHFEMAPDQVAAAQEENPDYHPKIENLTLAGAVELSLIHSRDFQTQIENLFLTSLQLTFERFRFKVRYLGIGGGRPTSVLTGESVPSTEDSLTWSNRIGISRLMPWGAQWAVELSNNTLWLFSSDQTGSASSLSYSLVQPLLQGAGRKVVLESLTQSERNVLYAVRSFARFRQNFFTSIVAGTSGTTTPGATGGVSSGAGGGVGYLTLLTTRQSIKNQELNIRLIEAQSDRLQVLAALRPEFPYGSVRLPADIKFPEEIQGKVVYDARKGQIQWLDAIDITDQDEQVLMRFADDPYFLEEVEKFVRARIIDRKGGELKLPVKPAENALPEIQKAEIQKEYEEALETFPERKEAFDKDVEERLAVQLPEAIADYRNAIGDLVDNIRNVTTPLQVTQLQSQLVNARRQLLTQQVNYQRDLDQFKFDQLGLPTDTILTIDESMLKPFELIDPNLFELQTRAELLTKTREPLDPENPNIEAIRDANEQLTQLRDDVNSIAIEMLNRDFERFDANLEYRMQDLETEADRDRVISNIENDKRLYGRILDDLKINVDQVIERVRNSLDAPPDPDPDLQKERLAGLIVDVQTTQEDLLTVVQGMTVIQINLRVELIRLNRFNQTMSESVKIGLEERLDLMNSRATVMDLRRKIEVSGNNLLGILDLRFEGDVNTRGLLQNTQPLEFIGSESSYRAGLNFTAPLDQVSQRNAYRTTLIAYQRARRDYMLAEDQVKFDVRQAWRQVDVNRKTFEIQRQSIRINARQFDQTVETTTKNPDAASSANSGLNLIQALNGVLNAQNQLIQNWVSYETARLNIHRDMGIMQIDETGLWLDGYYQQLRSGSVPADSEAPAAEALPPPAPAADFPEMNDEANSEIAPPPQLETDPNNNDRGPEIERAPNVRGPIPNEPPPLGKDQE